MHRLLALKKFAVMQQKSSGGSGLFHSPSKCPQVTALRLFLALKLTQLVNMARSQTVVGYFLCALVDPHEAFQLRVLAKQ